MVVDPNVGIAPNASLMDPGYRFATVTPNNGADLAFLPRGILVGTGGDLTFDAIDIATGANATFVAKNLISGMIYAIRPIRIRVTGTSAADILAIY